MAEKKNKTKKAGKAEPAKEVESELNVFGLTEAEEKKLIEQIESEYQLAFWYIKPRWDEWALRLKLYNNQRRDKSAVGDPLMFKIHQTVLAELYDDKLAPAFEGREDGDDEVAEALTQTAEYDEEVMQKDQLDFAWIWDTLFYGVGMILFMEFNRDLMTPIPENIDPMTFYRDPNGRRINGDVKGRGKLRFCGRDLRMAMWEMQEAGVYKNFKKLTPTSTDLQSFYDLAQQTRDVNQGYSNISAWQNLNGSNRNYLLLEWFTYFMPEDSDKAELFYVTLGNERKKIIRLERLSKKKIPIIDRRVYPIPNQFEGASIMDFTEDKQRARAVVQNAALQVVKAGVESKYIYDQTRITNKHDLDEAQQKYIGVDGNPNNVISLAQKDNVRQDVDYIMKVLADGAESALGVPEINQGVLPANKRLATEIDAVSVGSGKRSSLSARLFGWSEKEFWQTWYSIYKDHFTDGLDQKIIRINGILGAKTRPLTRENLIADIDPDVKVESKAISEAKRTNRLRTFQVFINNTAGDPSANKRGMEKHVGKLIGLPKDEVDYFLPPLPEELRAREENALLEADKKVEVKATDDHFIHIAEHNKIQDNAVKVAHINSHLRALALQRARPDLFPALAPSGMNPTPGQPMETQIQSPEKTTPNTEKTVGIRA